MTLHPHWVAATKTTGDGKIYLNLAAIPAMLPAKLEDGRNVTLLLYGGVTLGPDGKVIYAKDFVVETPEELLRLPAEPAAPAAPAAPGDPIAAAVARSRQRAKKTAADQA